MKRTKKFMHSCIITAVLSFAITPGGNLTAAAALEKESVNFNQGKDTQNANTGQQKIDENATQNGVSTHLKGKSNDEMEQKEKGRIKESQIQQTLPNRKATTKDQHSKGTARNNTVDHQTNDSTNENTDEEQKHVNKMAKSQASEHASDNAKKHAAEKSAVFSKELSPELKAEDELKVEDELNATDELNTVDELDTYFFGSDSASSANPEGEDFYLGKLGYGSTVQFDPSTGGGIYFSSARAQKAANVYGYWFLSGMQKAPIGFSASEWGIYQAKLALQTYEAMKSVYGSNVRPVLFIDVEPALTGMKDFDYVNNQLIYYAFVQYLNQYGQGVKPGTYSSLGSWERTMGDFSPSTPGAYWVAYYPGEIPSDLTTSNPYWINFPGTDEKAQIWQYYGGYDDYNVALELP